MENVKEDNNFKLDLTRHILMTELL